MDKASEAAALEGSSENPMYAPGFRLKCAKRAAELYAELRAEQETKLRELLSYCERQRVGNPNADQAIAWGHAGALVQKIVNGEPVDEFDRLRTVLDGE